MTLVLLALMLLSGCKTLPLGERAPVIDGMTDSTEGWQAYYLAIQSMDEQSLRDEVANQQKLQAQGGSAARLHLALLYSLPESAVGDPALARKALRALSQDGEIQLAGLLKLLMDQLEARMGLQQQLADLQSRLQQQTQQLKEQKHDNLSLKEQINALEQQLQQLKAIEQNILKREVVGNGN
ncbi:hypothetical protein [Bowmanella dokdonensis]|uniref:Lipoprotein n=1 Tax=Bowmanella dokdonensis TaxID=751969 RepID=A0A939IRC9_9ALTE|nr:hypothetical protein [Bowmanella dokdonensis]MBN7825974.1 hypothetical protein [Bowmanella dokdonensis]